MISPVCSNPARWLSPDNCASCMSCFGPSSLVTPLVINTLDGGAMLCPSCKKYALLTPRFFCSKCGCDCSDVF